MEQLALRADPQPMYNLTVATAHTYFVGEGQWLVHNMCWPGKGTIYLGTRNMIEKAESVGAYNYKHWTPEGGNWRNSFMQVMSDLDNPVILDVDILDDNFLKNLLSEGLSYRHPDQIQPLGWELGQIYQNPHWRGPNNDRIQFIRNSSPEPFPQFLIKKTFW